MARAATQIENHPEEAWSWLRELFPRTGRALTLGLTGAPGVGKSTLAAALIRQLRREQCSVAVIAVDPASPWSGGAVLGDRIRMAGHHQDADVFIRSMSTRGHLGGLAAATSDLVLLFDAAGFDFIVIETVGVGQDEVDVASVAGATAVVLSPGQGDDIQALKSGLMEVADLFVINKADHDGADRLERDIRSALELAEAHAGWAPPIVRTVASDHQGIDQLLAEVRRFHAEHHARQRTAQHWEHRLRQMYATRLLARLDPERVAQAAQRVAGREADPYTIMEEWLTPSRHS